MNLTKRIIAMLALLPVFALFVACGEDPTGPNGPNNSNGDDPNGEEQYEDIKVVDGKVRFYLKEKENSTRTATNMTARDWAKSTVEMNGKSYNVELSDEETPRPYIEVPAADKYEAVLLTSNSDKWYGATPKSDIKLPYSQFYHTAISNIKAFPMYASYTKENGNKLVFNDGFAMIYVRLKGTAQITSVKVDSPTKGIAGYSSVNSKNEFVIKRGMDFAVLNCTNEGKNVQLSSSKYTNFRVMVTPGTYSKGLKITICDASHKAVFINTEALTLAAGDLYAVEMDYAPDEDLVYYEGYDNMVWGGDVMKGSEGYGFAPTADAVTIDSGAELTGYEESFAEVAYNNAGTGYIQSNTWSDVVGKSVGQSHRMSDSYIASRNLADEIYLFRTQEYPGYIAISSANSGRGLFTSTNTPHTKSIGRVKYTIQMAVQSGFTGNLQLKIENGGIIESAKVNGKEVDASYISYLSASAIINHVEKLIPAPSSATAKNEWSTVELEVEGATDGSRIYLADELTTAGVHGIYVNSIEARQMYEWEKKEGTLRVMQWNILYGMWQDQHNNYDNFVKWVKKYDPDICIWCESETISADQSTSAATNKYLPNGWSILCGRYGHAYAAVGGDHDNFPQTVTSKYPIKTVKRFTETDVPGKPISHGAGHFQIEVEGKKINIVAMHLWPQTYGYGVTGTAAQEESIAKGEGHYFREFEMQYLIDQTVNNANYASEEYWIFGGDTNSRSPLDAWYNGHADDDLILLPHKLVRSKTNMKDTIGDRYPRDYFMTTTYASSRIDILYASPKLFDCIENAIVVTDNWCYPRVTDNVRKWYYPSDHRPVLIDFKLK